MLLATRLGGDDFIPRFFDEFYRSHLFDPGHDASGRSVFYFAVGCSIGRGGGAQQARRRTLSGGKIPGGDPARATRVGDPRAIAWPRASRRRAITERLGSALP